MSNREQYTVNQLIPESIIPTVQNYVQLLEKYYEYMNLPNQPSEVINRTDTLREMKTVNNLFLQRLYYEIGEGFFPLDNISEINDNIIQNLTTIYRAKGSLESINILFSVIFGEEVDYWLPKDFILKASGGDWIQDNSITCQVINGDPFDIIGKYVEVTTTYPGQPAQTFEIEVNRVEQLDSGLIRIFLSRFSIRAFFVGSVLRYADVELRLINTANTIIERVSGGTGFTRGLTYNLGAYERNTVKSTLAGYGQGYVDRLGVYFQEVVTQRRFLQPENRINKYGIESVTRSARTDGLIVEDVLRDFETYRTIRYGQNITFVQYGSDGSRRISKTTDTSLNFPPDISIDWDTIIEEMIMVAEGISTGDYHSFLIADNGAGFARGDINNDGVIDLDDVEIFVRRIMGFKTSVANTSWIDTNIQADLLAGTFPAANKLSVETFRLLPIQFTPGAGGITKERVVQYGYNYPEEAFIATLESPNSGEDAIYIINSEPVARNNGFYNDTGGFLSDNVKLQDNDFYQEFSYVIRSGAPFEQYQEIIDKMIHPAGMKAFGEQLITGSIDFNVDFDSLLSFIYNRLFNEVAYAQANYDLFVMNKVVEDQAFALDTKGPTKINKPIEDFAYVLDNLSIFKYEYYYDFDNEGLYVDDSPDGSQAIPGQVGLGYVGITEIV